MSGTDEGAVSGSTVDAFALGYNQLTHMPRAWQLTEVLGVTHRVRVAVIDSGFALGMEDYENPDFPDPTDIPQWDISDDDEDVSGPSEAQAWHGTQVAGIAAAHMNNAYGTAGTGAQVIDLVLIRVGDEDGRMSWYDVAKAIHQAIGLGAEVINLSMAGTCDGLCQTLGAFSGLNATKEAIVDLAYENNVVVISAAGNGGADTVGDNLSTVTVLPCAYDHVICIGALAGTASNGTYTASKKRASYSNYGTTVDLWVPGSLHCTVLPGSSEARMCQGTSAAAPYAAGIAALMKAANSALTADQVAVLLRQSAQKGGEDSEVDRGGIIDAYAAVLAATGGKLPADRYEPNEDRTRAANLVIGASGATVQGCTISTSTDVDAYTFELAAERTINISAQYVQSFGDLQIELQDANGRVLYQGTFSGQVSSGLAYDQKFISATLPAGRYTLIVRGVTSSLAAYDLAIR
jgi:serine protease